jgi:hypothetical protein
LISGGAGAGGAVAAALIASVARLGPYSSIPLAVLLAGGSVAGSQAYLQSDALAAADSTTIAEVYLAAALVPAALIGVSSYVTSGNVSPITRLIWALVIGGGSGALVQYLVAEVILKQK